MWGLPANPVYLSLRGGGAYGGAPEDILQKALEALEKKRRLEEQRKAWTAEMVEGTLPDVIRRNAMTLLIRPYKNGIEWKALNDASAETRQTPLRLMLSLGGIASPWRWHVDSFYAMNFPQISVDVDAAKCKRAGISPASVLDVLGSYCGGAYISNYNQFGKVYRVMLQASPEYRLDEQALDNMFVRNGTEMAPISQFVTLKRIMGSEVENRFNLFSAITVNVNPAPGYSTGEVQQVIKEVANQSLPAGYGYEYGGISREEAASGGTQTIFIYAICILLIFLILACLYESFLIPFAVIFSVPFGLMGSFLFAKLFGLENNIYLQTGVIMLIGLLAKTAILITEYAIERRRKGMGIIESAYSAAQVRLRPILMTVLTMIFGMLPLMFASGAGANGNSSLGTGVVGGMAIGTLALLFVVPVFYIAFEFLQEKIRKPMEVEADLQVLQEQEKSANERENHK